MDEIRLKLAALWIIVMLIYLLGDVLRIFAGHFKPGEIGGMQMSQWAYIGIAAFMLIPILMVWFSLTLAYPAARWANIIVPVVLILFNLAGLPTYEGRYDQFLLVVSMIFNGVSVWTAWQWVPV